MDTIAIKDIPKIFVGRKIILTLLQELLNDLIIEKQADFIRILLNTPGIGKTKTIEHFGNAIMQCNPFPTKSSETEKTAKFALYIQITISNDEVNCCTSDLNANSV